MPIGVSEGRVPGGKLCKCDAEFMRHVVACFVGIGIRKTTAVFGNPFLRWSNNGSGTCRTIGSGSTIRIGASSLILSRLSDFVGVGATLWLWPSVTDTW